jgi:hypothetical protein
VKFATKALIVERHLARVAHFESLLGEPPAFGRNRHLGGPVCTENLNPHVMMMNSAKDRM